MRCLFTLLDFFEEGSNQQVWLQVGVLPPFLISVSCPLRGPLCTDTPHCFPWQVFPHFCTPASASPSEQSWLKIASFAHCFVSTQTEAVVGVKRNPWNRFPKKGGVKASLYWNGCQLRNFLRNDKDSHCGSSLGIASTRNTTNSVGEGSSRGLLRDWSWFGHQFWVYFQKIDAMGKQLLRLSRERS